MADLPDFTQPVGPGYDNLDDAAAGAQAHIDSMGDLPKKLEFVSVLYRNKQDGKIYRTAFNTSNNKGKADVQAIFSNMANDQIPLAVVHNHPEYERPNQNLDTSLLSDADSLIGTGFGKTGRGETIPISTGRGPTGTLKMYLIGMGGNEKLGVGNGNYRTYGLHPIAQPNDTVMKSLQTTDPVLAQIPITDMKQLIAQKVRNNPNLPTVYKVNILRKLMDVPQTAQNGLMGQPMESPQ